MTELLGDKIISLASRGTQLTSRRGSQIYTLLVFLLVQKLNKKLNKSSSSSSEKFDIGVTDLHNF